MKIGYFIHRVGRSLVTLVGWVISNFVKVAILNYEDIHLMVLGKRVTSLYLAELLA